MPVRVVHLTASFPRSAADATAPFLLDLVRDQRAAGWDANVVAVHDAGLPPVQLLDGVPVHRARYGPDDWEVLAYRGGGHAKLRSPLHALLLPGLLLPGIDWRAHVGGLLTGAVLGAAAAYAPPAKRNAIQLGTAVAVVLVLVGLVAYRTNELNASFGL